MRARIELLKNDGELHGYLVEGAAFRDLLGQGLASRGGKAHELQQLNHDLFVHLVVREAIDLISAEGDQLEALDLVLNRLSDIVMGLRSHESAEDLERGLLNVQVAFGSDLGVEKCDTAMSDDEIDQVLEGFLLAR